MAGGLFDVLDLADDGLARRRVVLHRHQHLDLSGDLVEVNELIGLRQTGIGCIGINIERPVGAILRIDRAVVLDSRHRAFQVADRLGHDDELDRIGDAAVGFDEVDRLADQLLLPGIRQLGPGRGEDSEAVGQRIRAVLPAQELRAVLKRAVIPGMRRPETGDRVFQRSYHCGGIRPRDQGSAGGGQVRQVVQILPVPPKPGGGLLHSGVVVLYIQKLDVPDLDFSIGGIAIECDQQLRLAGDIVVVNVLAGIQIKRPVFSCL